MFDSKYWIRYQLYLGILLTLILGIIISHGIVYLMYPTYDKKQKLIKLKLLDIDPILQKDVIPHLEPYCDYNKDIMNIIFKYSNITLQEDNLTEYIDSIMTTTITKQLLKDRLICYILVTTMLIFAYVPIYLFAAHLQDSYRSFVEIACIPMDKSHCYAGKMNSYCSGIWQFDMNDICINNTLDINNYNFYGEFAIASDSNVDIKSFEHKKCYINKHDFSIRGNDTCCWGIDGICGKYCSYCHGCNGNCCCYIWCALFGVIILSMCVWFIMSQIHLDLFFNYHIKSTYDPYDTSKISLLHTSIETGDTSYI